MTDRAGPKITVQIHYSCEDCQHHTCEKYTCQSDWGFNHYCFEPSMAALKVASGLKDTRTYIGEDSNTPTWCPFRGDDPSKENEKLKAEKSAGNIVEVK